MHSAGAEKDDEKQSFFIKMTDMTIGVYKLQKK